MKPEDIKALYEELDKSEVEKFNNTDKPTFILGLMLGGLLATIVWVLLTSLMIR